MTVAHHSMPGRVWFRSMALPTPSGPTAGFNLCQPQDAGHRLRWKRCLRRSSDVEATWNCRNPGSGLQRVFNGLRMIVANRAWDRGVPPASHCRHGIRPCISMVRRAGRPRFQAPPDQPRLAAESSAGLAGIMEYAIQVRQPRHRRQRDGHPNLQGLRSAGLSCQRT